MKSLVESGEDVPNGIYQNIGRGYWKSLCDSVGSSSYFVELTNSMRFRPMLLTALFSVILNAAQPASVTNGTYAVLDIANEKGELTALSSYIGDELSLRYASDSGYSLVERGQLKKVLKEHSLQASGTIDEATVSSLGRFLGASRIITGQYYQMGDDYVAMIRVLDVATSKVLKMAKVSFPKSSSTQMLAQTILGGAANSVGQVVKSTTVASTELPQGQGPLLISKCKALVSNYYCDGFLQSTENGQFDIPFDQQPFFLDDGNIAKFYTFHLAGSDNRKLEIPAGVKTHVEVVFTGTSTGREFRTFKLKYSFAGKEYVLEGVKRIE